MEKTPPSQSEINKCRAAVEVVGVSNEPESSFFALFLRHADMDQKGGSQWGIYLCLIKPLSAALFL